MGIMKTLTINGTKYNLTPVVPASSVTLLASEWVGDGDTYSQVVELPGVSLSTKVDLQPTPEQLEEFHYLTLGFIAENEGGIVTVYAIGDKPTNDHTIQVTLTEVEANGKIRGNTVGTTIPKVDWNQEDPTKADYIMNKPNINDQTPTFTQDSTGENIVSGENLSTIFGKVMRAIADSTSHLQSIENPHGVSVEQIGARPSSWMPTASDVGARPNTWTPTASDVGARPETWLPTIAEIGAAPAGYGLGGAPVNAPNDNLDAATENGWYSCSSATIGRPTGLNNIEYGTVLVIRRYGQDVTQLYVSQPNTSVGAPYLLVRNCSSYNAWNPWEWINPPMLAGVEYRTTERYMGKPVYAKLVDCKGMPSGANAAKAVQHNSANVESIVSFGGNMSVGGTKAIALPYYYSDTNLARISVDTLQVRISNGGTDLVGYNDAKVWFKYTKTTA